MAQCGVSNRLSHLARVQIPSRRRDMWVEFVMGSFPCFESFFLRVLYCTVMRSLCDHSVDVLPLSYSFIHSFICLFIYGS